MPVCTTSSSSTGDAMMARLKQELRALLGNAEGAALVEFALLAPLLVVLGLGAAELGRAVQDHHVLEKSARDAARYLSRVPASCAGGIAAADIATAKNLAWTGYANGTAPLLSYWQDPASNSTVTVTVNCYPNNSGTILNRVNGPSSAGIPLITVSIDVPYIDMGFLALFGAPAISLKSTHSEVSIGE